MNKHRMSIITVIILITLLCISLAACSFGNSAGNTGNKQGDNQRYSASDETAMAVGRIKGASYQPDLSSIVGEFTETASAEAAAEPSAPPPTFINNGEENKEITGIYASDELIPTKTMWLDRVQNDQKAADEWGEKIKTKIYKYIDKAAVFDKWIQTPTLSFGDENYVSFMIHYDYETDTVILYENVGDLCAYMYYFDENGNEVLEVFVYSMLRDDNFVPSEYTKYVKDVSYTFVHTREEHTAYYNLSNNNGELSFVSYEQITENNETIAKLDTLVNDGAKALYYSTSSNEGDASYNQFEYIYNGEKLFSSLDTYSSDIFASHPVTEIEYSLRALDGFKYVANVEDSVTAYLFEKYLGDRIYSETNPTGDVFSLSSFYHKDGRTVGGVDDYIILLDVQPVTVDADESYVDATKITGAEAWDQVYSSGPKTLDKAYYQELFAKIASTETPNGYDYIQNLRNQNLVQQDTNPIFIEFPLHQGWKLVGTDISTMFDPKLLTPADKEAYYGSPDIEITNPGGDVTYLAEANWYTGGGKLRIFDYEGIDFTDDSLPLHLKSEYLPYYYDFRALDEDYGQTIKNISILDVTDVLSTSGQTTLLAKVKKMVENEFCNKFDINNFTIVTPDQLENTTAAMLTPTIKSGDNVTASLTDDGKKLNLSVNNMSVSVAKNILLQSGAEYRAEIGYFNANNVITTSLVGPGTTYDGNDLTLSISGSVEVVGNMIFDEDYTVCAFVSKKIDGKFVKVSSGVQLATSQSAVAPDTFIMNNFDKIVGDDFKLGYGAKNVNGKMSIVKRGIDDVVPTITVDGYTSLDDISLFIGEGLSISAVYEIPYSSIANLAELKAIIKASDNVNGTISIGLNNFAKYVFEGEEDEDKTLEATDTIFKSYSDMIHDGILVITIADSSGNTTQIAIAFTA